MTVGRSREATPRTSGAVMLETQLIALGVLFTTATQLRMDAVPVGVGELLLLAWILWRLMLIALSPPRWRLSFGAASYVWFWVLLPILLSIAFAVSYYRGLWDEQGAAHDAMGVMFSGMFSVLLLHFLDTPEKIRLLAMSLFRWCAVLLGALLVVGLSGVSPPGIEPWYGGIRFTGWAKNPNQIAFLLATVPFLGVWADTAREGAKRGPRLLLLALIGLVGALTLSDALYVGWIGGTTVVLGLWWLRSILNASSGQSKSLMSVVLLPAVAVVVVMLLWPVLTGQIGELLIERYQVGGQGSIRLGIWENALTALNASPYIGHGPGAFSGIWTAFEGFETHNTYLDIATKGGLLAMAAFLAILGASGLKLLAKGEVLLFGALVSIMLFSSFHYVLRQPAFWLFVVISIQVSWGTTRRPNDGPYSAGQEIAAGDTQAA